MTPELIQHLLRSREALRAEVPLPGTKVEAEGGCGVVGLASSIPVVGRHILVPCAQMHNRGNGKGGGLTAAGLVPTQIGVAPHQLATDYLLQIALLDPAAREAVHRQFIDPYLEVHTGYRIPTVDDWRDVEGLEVRPPDVWRYFARVKDEALTKFVEEHQLGTLDRAAVEDEYISQWAFRLNKTLYSDGKMQAFVLSYGRDMLVLKIVGYAEQAFRYYRMEDVQARVWIGHQRYPTKGRIWHPGGAHPFAALDVALVHNGDFANYHAVSEYLAQRNFHPLFLTDTEVAVLLFDLWSRVFGYSMEHLIEAMAPTTERDFLMLPDERRRRYRAIQATHIHGSPDGPWFFIIARTLRGRAGWQLLGITDTSMLRPQVFALQEGAVNVGVIASEKQAIDATLASLAYEDARICPVADRYWNARGGSYTDGGTFLFTVGVDGQFSCTDKFGRPVTTPPGQVHYLPTIQVSSPIARTGGARRSPIPDLLDADTLFAQAKEALPTWSFNTLVAWLEELRRGARTDESARGITLKALTRLLDRRLPTGTKKRSSVHALIQTAIYSILRDVPVVGALPGTMHRIDWIHRAGLGVPERGDYTLIVDAQGFPSEGEQSLSQFLVRAYRRGWRALIVFDLRGQRFLGCGFGPDSDGCRLDVYGSPGDYLASGLDGLELHVHNSAQDQVGQIFKAGKLVVHGDVGQTLLYGAKGGEIYILGNAAGRPLINAVGRPRIVINGTALDYLAESFMAGDPLDGGGFVILNGLDFEVDGRPVELETPYPGGNLFSLASGGAIYARDPYHRLDDDQLNGGHFTALTDADWETIRPYLEENARLFEIPLDRLLTVDDRLRSPQEIYRKIEPIQLAVLK